MGRWWGLQNFSKTETRKAKWHYPPKVQTERSWPVDLCERKHWRSVHSQDGSPGRTEEDQGWQKQGFMGIFFKSMVWFCIIFFLLYFNWYTKVLHVTQERYSSLSTVRLRCNLLTPLLCDLREKTPVGIQGRADANLPTFFAYCSEI